MKNDKTNAISFIYKRSKVKKEENVDYYTYEFVDVVKGTLHSEDSSSVIFTDENNNDYNSINDFNSMDDEYIYAFPTNTDFLSEEEKIKKLKDRKKEVQKFNNYLMFQIHYKNKIESFFVNPNNPNEFFSVDLFDIDEINEIVADKTDIKTSVSIITPKDNDESCLYADDIYNEVSKTVICQDEQIKDIASSICKNQRIHDPKLKDTLLICGPTGVGKTEIFRCISNISDIPITIEDSTEYTANGYKGKDVTDMLYNLYINSGMDVERAEKGIILIDEIDKKISKRDDIEVYTKAVLDSLLKMSEGHLYHVENKEGRFDIDTSFITFAFLGAFSGIEDYNKNKKNIGFMTNSDILEQNDPLNTYTEQTLLKYGIKPEFLGRSKLIVMNNLGVEELKKIIETSDKSHLLLYKLLLQELGIDFKYDDKTIETIAIKAHELGVGARSIKKIMEKAFKIINYEIFSRNNYHELTISSDTFEDNTQFTLK